MMEMLMTQLGVIQRVFQVNTDGITHEESLRPAGDSGNCLNWIAGHLVATYDSILPTLGEETVWDASQADIYQRGSDPAELSETAVDFSQIVEAFGAAHERLVQGLRRLPPERLTEPAPFSPGNNPDETLGSLLHLIAFHQAYHLGQLGLGRRLLGKSGGIK